MSPRYATLALCLLAGCGGPAPAPEEASKTGASADPAPAAGEVVSYQVELALGHHMDLKGEVTDQEKFTWQDAAGKTHTIEAPAELKPMPEGVCIYLVTSADGKPVLPLKVMVVDFLEYCMVGQGPKIMGGSIKEEREARFIEDGKPVSYKASVLRLEAGANAVP